MSQKRTSINRWKYRLAFRILTCALFLSAIVLLCADLVIGINIRPILDIHIVNVIHGIFTFSIKKVKKQLTSVNSFLHEIIITLGYHSWASNTNIVHVVKWQVFIYSHNKNKFIDCGHREITSIIKVLYRDNIYNVAMNTIN